MDNIRDIFNSITDAAIARVDPYKMIKERLVLNGTILEIHSEDRTSRFDLSEYDDVYVVGAGKATAKMALAVEEILGEYVTEGVISVKKGHTEGLNIIRIIEAGHPVPDDNSLKAGNAIYEICERASERSFVINLISGGGSALLEKPNCAEEVDGEISLEDLQTLTGQLLACGASIGEINAVRKHISAIKGGGLAQVIYPAASVSLILSDVIGDRLDTIASGMTVPDQTTFEDVDSILRKYQLKGAVPKSVRALIEAGVAGLISDNLKEGDPECEKTQNILIGTNYTALRAAVSKAEDLGFNSMVLSTHVEGEAREIAKFYCAIGKDIKKYDLPVSRPACIVAGGETTVTIKGDGKGGRNQEMALAFLNEIAYDEEGCDGIYFASVATDGNDGPTDAAGAFASREILHVAMNRSFSPSEYLDNNDAYHFYEAIGWLLKTGPTNTNVCDLQILLVP